MAKRTPKGSPNPPKPQRTAPLRSREKRVTGAGKSVYRRAEDTSSWYASPQFSVSTPAGALERGLTQNKNAARDQRRWNEISNPEQVKRQAAKNRNSKKSK